MLPHLAPEQRGRLVVSLGAALVLVMLIALVLRRIEYLDYLEKNALPTPTRISVSELQAGNLPDNRHVILTDVKLSDRRIIHARYRSRLWGTVYSLVEDREDETATATAPKRPIVAVINFARNEAELNVIKSKQVLPGCISDEWKPPLGHRLCSGGKFLGVEYDDCYMFAVGVKPPEHVNFGRAYAGIGILAFLLVIALAQAVLAFYL